MQSNILVSRTDLTLVDSFFPFSIFQVQDSLQLFAFNESLHEDHNLKSLPVSL